MVMLTSSGSFAEGELTRIFGNEGRAPAGIWAGAGMEIAIRHSKSPTAVR